MNNDPQQVTQSETSSDEIDLFQLFQSIWQEKWLAIAVTALIFIIALAYTVLVTPIYQAKIKMMPAAESHIAAYNALRVLDREYLQEKTKTDSRPALLSASDAYSIFMANFLSEKTKQEFLQELSSASSSTFTLKTSKIYPQYGQAIVDVMVDSENPELALAMANAYVDFVLVQSKKEMDANFNAELNMRIDYLKRHIQVLRNQVSKEQESEANSQLLLSELQGLNIELAMLSAIKIDDKATQLARVDSPAILPVVPTKPRKRLIMAASLILGGLLGVFSALIRGMMRKRQTVLGS